MAEAAGQNTVQRPFAGVAERRVAEVVAEGDRLGEIFVERKADGDRARDLGHLKRVGQARAVVVGIGRQKDLRLMLQAPEGVAVNDAVAVALKRCAHFAFRLGLFPALCVGTQHAIGRDGQLFLFQCTQPDFVHAFTAFRF